jgi:hypothetical protein
MNICSIYFMNICASVFSYFYQKKSGRQMYDIKERTDYGADTYRLIIRLTLCAVHANFVTSVSLMITVSVILSYTDITNYCIFQTSVVLFYYSNYCLAQNQIIDKKWEVTEL